MSANDTTTWPGSSPGSEPTSISRAVLQSLIIAHTFLTLMVPLLFALLYYSTPHSRRHPIFILNVITIIMALSSGVIADVAGIHAILSPGETLPAVLYLSSGVIGIFLCMLVDLILLMRLVYVYPLSWVGYKRFALITSLPVLLKVARVVNVAIFLKVLADIMNNQSDMMTSLDAYFALPNLKIEWVAQVVDNTYVSIMFLRTIRNRGTTSECPSGCSTIVQSTWAYRLKTLFRIALSNFVVPTLFSIVQLIIIFHGSNAGYAGDVVYVNSMLSAYGVVFASVWAGKESRRELEEARHSLNPEDSDRHRSTNNTLGVGKWSVAKGPMSFVVEATEDEVDSQSEALDGTLGRAKRGLLGADLEASHEIALIPFEREGQGLVPSSPARTCSSVNSVLS